MTSGLRSRRLTVLALVLALVLGSWVVVRAIGSERESTPRALVQTPTTLSPDISLPDGQKDVFIPDRYRTDGEKATTVSNGPSTTIFFSPQDTNTSATVLFLYNTSDVTGTVELESFGINGAPVLSTSFQIPSRYLVRICADSVSTLAPSWQDALIINFTDNSAYARMTLPAGVKADGYVVWNDGSTYDPQQIAPTLNLRFSADPDSVFLPSVRQEDP